MPVSRWEHHVDVLGPVVIRGAGGIVAVTRSMEIGVLGLLALNAGSPVSSGSLIDLLWPDEPPRTAGKTLQGYVKRVRGMVAVNGLELTHGGSTGYVLKLAPHEVDAVQFESLVAHARTSADDAARLRRIDDALALWRGVPFAGCELAGIQPHREWLVRLCGGTRVDRVAVQIRLGVTAETFSGIRALLIDEPTNERLWLHLAGASYLAGNPVAALEAIAEARRELVDRAGVELGPELAELQRHLLDHDDVPGCYARLTGAPRPTIELGGGPPVPAPRATTQLSLPQWDGELLGRDEVVAEITGLIAGGCSIVTVLGPGGMGKTRCAVEAARHSSVPCRGFLDLSTLVTGPGLALHLAGSFGVPDRDDPVAAVASQLTGERCTVIMDNVEQIEGAADVLAELAARCPSVGWLITSQIELGLPSERIVRLPPLPTSAENDPGPSEQLLAQAARRRGVRLGADAPLAEIAAQIGGIPLALELAACQLQYLPPDALLQALAEPLDALVDPRRSVGRHRSMRACFDLGLARLGSDATDLFALVSHRPGGCRYSDLAAGWTRTTPLSRAVAELVEVGLAATSPDTAGATRLTQLPLVRSLGRSLPPVADADVEAALDLGVLGRAQASLAGADPTTVEPDLPDIRRLLQRGVDDPASAEPALQLAVLLAVYWWSSRITEGRRWLDTLLSRTAGIPSPIRPYGIQTSAFLDFYVGDGVSSARRLDEALATEVPDPNAQSRLLALRAMLDAAADDHALAMERAARAIELARIAGDEEVLSYALGNGGDVASAAGEVQLARERYVECIDRMRRRGQHWLSAAPHARLADLDVSAGEHRRARMWFERSITLWSSRELGPGAPQTLAGLGRLDVLEGDLIGARQHLGLALSTAERCGSRGEYPWVVLGYAALMAAAERRDEAAVLFGLGLRHGPRAGHCARRLIEAELAPLYAWALPDPRSVATDPRVLATSLEDLPAAVTAIIGQ